MGGTPRFGRVLGAGKVPGCQAESSQTDVMVLWRALRCGQVLVAPGLWGSQCCVGREHSWSGALQSGRHLSGHSKTAN